MLVIAHRGASGHRPENTLSAIDYALTLGAKAIELDVHCVEGELYVFHDRRLEFKSSGLGVIDRHSRDELSHYTVAGEAIPTLWQVMELVAGRAMINIELKGVHTLAPLLEQYPWFISKFGFSAEQLLISSFNHRYLEQLRQLLPDAAIGILYSGIPLSIEQDIAAIKPQALHLDISFISHEMLHIAKQYQLKTYVYTVDFIDDIYALQQLGVDGIFTNFPDRAFHALEQPSDQIDAHWFD
ncbi:glycerophosphodiester phosphodiesterase [Shewanella avicenniae]|uniref:Glycerophosphodiester phosphodiesterase n=1 Tax=Shewanella avicenniae TaxID=2814294 RepID=A0ABX7QS96_9GAMM|nr:glycerophosphodiester phosphodiesterase [Shewanella avicenniae]QSX34322.1 glycerophosphodiester phosphodiesterase [Shewanella avicenniae]